MLSSVGVARRATAGFIFGRALASRIQLPVGRSINSARSYAVSLMPELRRADDGLILDSADKNGRRKEEHLSADWLRDGCACHLCINGDTQQRRLKLNEVPLNPRIASFQVTGTGFEVKWNDGHESSFSWEWISAVNNSQIQFNHRQRLWTGQMARDAPQVLFQDVMTPGRETGMAKLLDTIRVWGFCFVNKTPVTPQATEQLLENIGPIRNTHYGAFYDFQPDLAKADTAYTNLALPLHTDTTYFTEPAGLQAFHILSHTPTQQPCQQLMDDETEQMPSNDAKETNGDLGGSSVLADGFMAAQQLQLEAPQEFDILTRVSVPWHCSGNEDVAIAPDRPHPVIQLHQGACNKIRWNNSDRGYLAPGKTTAQWYKAARKWEAILERRSSQFWVQLEPGRVLIFDNWRVLHGRSAFEGLRRICGGYINRDDFVSRWSLTNHPRQQVIWQNMRVR
ncbi:hypothetical protein CDD82_2654 [Ophiocordyceps australis]|uniref:trimethyllysine dioxygenase n=1 Tax=Ophiocordyceps australis TaxID=1399860 RepID=A0A2C5ZV76_9HYPO|nr:hypothetical protein CDD82_2654 [Ophiocordyceps australis]